MEGQIALAEEERGDRGLQAVGGALLLRVPKGCVCDLTQPGIDEDRLAIQEGVTPPLPTAHQLPHARLRQTALDPYGAEDREAVGRLLPHRRPVPT